MSGPERVAGAGRSARGAPREGLRAALPVEQSVEFVAALSALLANQVKLETRR